MKFGTIIADPPWPYLRANKKVPQMRGYSNFHYEPLTIADLCALPVCEVAADHAVLMLWTTPAFSATGEATELCKAWGFRPVTHTYWIKTTSGGGLTYGVGYWFRGVVEPVLVGSRGKAFRTSERGAFFARNGGHSRKPEDLHRIAEKHDFPEPRLEMFGRQAREGWTVIGNEAPGDGRDIRESLAALGEA